MSTDSVQPLHYVSWPREWIDDDRRRLDEERARMSAVYRTIGAADYLLGPVCHLNARERLVRLGEVIEELRVAVGLSDPIECKYKRPARPRKPTNSTGSSTGNSTASSTMSPAGGAR